MYRLIKRFFDIISSVIVVLLLFPFLLIIACLIIFNSKGGAFYKQKRIGINQKPFFLLKFRSMRTTNVAGAEITIGNDPRITRIGAFIRRYKIDELPQLINIIKGDMSVVGPRPEVQQYVNLYSDEQLKVLKVKPGLTDYASLKYFNEQEILGKAEDPHQAYVEMMMPKKLNLNLKYISEISFKTDFIIICKTILRIVKK
ncbi:MAG: sugar transferase [Crocinitomicaceae bacterium]